MLEWLSNNIVIAIIFGALALLLILFIILFIVAADKNRRLKDDIAQYKRIKGELDKANESSRQKFLETSEKANETANANAHLLEVNKNLEAALQATRGEVGALNMELAETKAKNEKLEKKLKKAVKKAAEPKVEKPKVFTKEELDKMTKHELLTLAKARNLTGFYHINKDELVKFILEEQNKEKTAK